MGMTWAFHNSKLVQVSLQEIAVAILEEVMIDMVMAIMR